MNSVIDEVRDSQVAAERPLLLPLDTEKQVCRMEVSLIVEIHTV